MHVDISILVLKASENMLASCYGVNVMEMRSNRRANCVNAGRLSSVNLFRGLLAAALLLTALGHIGAHNLRARTSYGVETHSALRIRPCMVASRTAEKFQDHKIYHSRTVFSPVRQAAEECPAGITLYSSSCCSVYRVRAELLPPAASQPP